MGADRRCGVGCVWPPAMDERHRRLLSAQPCPGDPGVPRRGWHDDGGNQPEVDLQGLPRRRPDRHHLQDGGDVLRRRDGAPGMSPHVPRRAGAGRTARRPRGDQGDDARRGHPPPLVRHATRSSPTPVPTRSIGSYLLLRARQGSRRVLSLLLYAQSCDLVVPDGMVHALYEQITGTTGSGLSPHESGATSAPR